MGTAVTGIGYAWFHLATYGGLTPYVVNVLYAGKDTLELVGSHFVLWERLYRLAGLWFDGEFGVLRWTPVLVLALPAVPWLLRQPPRVRWTLALLLVTQVLVAVFFSLTMRGWWFPAACLIVVLPLLAPLLAWTLSRVQASALWMGGAAALGLYTLLITRALYAEAAAEDVVLVVDPFALAWEPFRLLAQAYPFYTSYEPRTWILTGFWLLRAQG